ncbi:hypothetical protein AB6A40_011623 [Gnathostoma spinigerum]|uniref:Uncharacterized protein n=1 Tax=Gnathostoma spinigerum TaxID=75299 RepID=A0ABD6EY53_9BILA
MYCLFSVPIDIPLHASRFLIPVLILLTISFLLVAASIVLMTYKRNLLCFERGIRYTTSVGFSNISQTTDASSPSGSERLASFAR